MDLGLKDCSVLITGSSSGIGQATAVAFGKEGARVAVTYQKNRRGAEDTANKVETVGGQAMIEQYDLADPNSIRSCILRIQKEWETLYVLINNAAWMVNPGPTQQLFENVPQEHWQSMLRTNVEGAAFTIQCVLPLMRKAGWGRIVNLSSDATDGWPGLGPYATVKARLHGLTHTLAVELGPANILSNVVMPGFVLTEHNRQRVPPEYREQIRQHTPTRQLVTPEDIAAVIVFLASSLNRQINGEIIRVTGGPNH